MGEPDWRGWWQDAGGTWHAPYEARPAESATPPKAMRRLRPWFVLVFAGLLVGGVVAYATLRNSDGHVRSVAVPTSIAPQPATFTIHGTFRLRDDTYILPGLPCVGTGGFRDIRGGTQVTVKDENGTLLGVSELSEGEYDALKANSTVVAKGCLFTFDVGSLPRRSFYKVEVSHRGEQVYSFDDLMAQGGEISLTLG